MVKQILIAIDQLFNALFGGFADETISARLYRCRERSWWWAFWYRAVNVAFFWQYDHCLYAFQSEQWRRQLPKGYQQQEVKKHG